MKIYSKLLKNGNIFTIIFFYFNLCNKYFNIIKPIINDIINKKNIILGVIIKYHPIENVFPFFNSIIHASIKICDVVVILIPNNSKPLVEYLKKIKIYKRRDVIFQKIFSNIIKKQNYFLDFL